MSFSVYSPGVAVHVLEQPLRRADQREPDPLHHARVTQRERRRRDPADDAHHHRRREDREADPAVVVAGGVDVVEVVQQPGGEHERDVHDDEDQEPDQHQKVQGARGLDAEHLADPLEAGRQRRRHAEPGDERERRGDEDRDEVGEELQAVVRDPAVLGRPVQRQVLDQDRQRRWGTPPSWWARHDATGRWRTTGRRTRGR